MLPRARPLIEDISGHFGDTDAFEAIFVRPPRMVFHLVGGDPLPRLVALAVGNVDRKDRHDGDVRQVGHVCRFGELGRDVVEVKSRAQVG